MGGKPHGCALSVSVADYFFMLCVGLQGLILLPSCGCAQKRLSRNSVVSLVGVFTEARCSVMFQPGTLFFVIALT